MATSREFFTARFDALDQDRISARQIANIGKAALDMIEMASPTAAQASRNDNLSDQGKRAARRDALKDMFVANEQARRALATLKREANNGLSALALPALAKDDIVGEMREAEARSIVRSMPQDKRDSINRLPNELATAVIRAPAALSGVSPSVHAMLRNQLIEAAHPEQVAAFRSDLSGIEMAEHVVKEVNKKLFEAAALSVTEEQDLRKQLAETPTTKPAPDPSMDFDAMVAAHRQRHGIKTS